MVRVEHLAVVGTLAAGLAHEINNPLAGLRTAVERLLRLARDPADAERYGTILTQVVLNLLLNACDAMPGGGEIALRAALQGDEAVLVVSDGGTGVSPEIASRIFDPFFTTKPPGKGTGLGLAVSRAGIREAGGELELVAREGAGASFRIRLPLERRGKDGTHPPG